MISPAIKITKLLSSEVVEHEVIRFSGGELQVRLPAPNGLGGGAFVLRASLTSADAIMELHLVVDALRRQYGWDVRLELICPYLPYARQDRVCAPGEALSLRVMCDLINALSFDRVEIWDPHSDVAMALLDRAEAVPQATFVSRLPLGSNIELIAPDAGAAKKIAAVSAATGLPYLTASKQRDLKTGAITHTAFDASQSARGDYLIVDDICDGGRTFIELAKLLRRLTAGRVLLFVTHGIFSQGLGVFEGLIDHVYTANAFPGVAVHPLLTEI